MKGLKMEWYVFLMFLCVAVCLLTTGSTSTTNLMLSLMEQRLQRLERRIAFMCRRLGPDAAKIEADFLAEEAIFARDSQAGAAKYAETIRDQYRRSRRFGVKLGIGLGLIFAAVTLLIPNAVGWSSVPTDNFWSVVNNQSLQVLLFVSFCGGGIAGTLGYAFGRIAFDNLAKKHVFYS